MSWPVEWPDCGCESKCPYPYGCSTNGEVVTIPEGLLPTIRIPRDIPIIKDERGHICVFVPLRSTDGVVQPEYGECLICGQCERRDPPHYGYSTEGTSASVSSQS